MKKEVVVHALSILISLQGLFLLASATAPPVAESDTSLDGDNVSPTLKGVRDSTIRYNTAYTTSTGPIRPLEEIHRAANSVGVRLRSLYPGDLDVWFDDGGDGIPMGHLKLGQETTSNSYEGHVFFFTVAGEKDQEISRFTVSKDKILYLIEDPENPPPKALQDATYRELAFMDDYLAEHGYHWRHYYGPNGPRGPPSEFMWPAERVGDIHTVTSTEGYWLCKDDNDPSTCAQEPLTVDNPLHLNLRVVSLAPKAFVIDHFLSDFEIADILRLAKPKMSKSIVGEYSTGAYESKTRTSRNGWLNRPDSKVIETLYKRAEHLLQIESLEKHNAESIQVVSYQNGQKYDAHHDWGVSGYPESRYITLLLYLSDMADSEAGGETAFPKGADGLGFKVHPGKGSAVLFYNLLEDGNGDDLALHAALPVKRGEKWLANFWVWDPKRHD